MEAADFSGYATKANLKCSDGRTILPDAFQHQDQEKVPLVWQHAHNEPTNVLGYAVLEHREDGVYCYAFFNETEQAQAAKQLVQHGDISSLSIYANRLVERGKSVLHGMIREVSLVLSGANPGALIDNVRVAHSDGEIEISSEDAIIYTGLPLEHSDLENTEEIEEEVEENEEQDILHADGDTVKDVFDTLTEEQKNVVYFMIGEALKGEAAAHADGDSEASLAHGATIKDVFDSFSDSQKDVVYFMIGEALENANSAAHSDNPEGNEMTHNVFEQDATKNDGPVLSHADVETIVKDARSIGSFKDAVEGYALKHGIDDIDILFPDARAVTSTPEFLKRRTEWVSSVLTETRHTPFSRIKSLGADLTMEDARAKGYIKGNLKREEFFKVSKRVTTPQTVYKKQKLDRDDILDITDFDVVVWLKAEMRLMLEEEIARAILFGDGRSVADEDKISEDHVRSIANDDDFYATTVYVNIDDASSSSDEIVDQITLERKHYRGSGTPTFYTQEDTLTKLLLAKDTVGRRLYRDVADLASTLRVSRIVPVEAMEGDTTLLGIIVNLQDYTVGADKGGDVSFFDDFDIDYNQQKYLIETRVSGALTKPKSALVIRKTAAANVLVDPVTEPTFNEATGVVTIPSQTGVVYKNADTGATLTAGAQPALADGATLNVLAVPAAGYYFSTNAEDEWSFTNPA